VIKTLLFCLCAIELCAQPVFQKKIENVGNAVGLAWLPDGGYQFAGFRGNCIQFIRFDALGAVVWMRQLCPNNPDADLTINALQLVAATDNSGAFFLLFRKSAFSSAPDNLLNVIKFDASGNLVWEQQLRPERRYGDFSPGSQLAITPSGEVWAAHAMGYTDTLPFFNQALVFKVNLSGQTVLRRFYHTDIPATANGIAAKNDQEVIVYGALGFATTGGFLLKLNQSGDIIWSKEYGGLNFLQDAGFLPNGDLLLLAEHEDAYALARIASDGALVWAAKFVNSPNIFHCAVTADGMVLLAGEKPNNAALLFKINPFDGVAEWAKSYEDCTRYMIKALQTTADGGVAFTQSSSSGLLVSRLVKADDFGQLSPECPVFEMGLPSLESIQVAIFPLSFTYSGEVIGALEHLFRLSETTIEIKDCCPAAKPEALFELPDSICTNAPFDLIALETGCNDEWHWTLPGGMPETADGRIIQDVVWQDEGVFSLGLTTTIGFCKDSISRDFEVIQVSGLDVFDFSDTTVCPDQPFVIQPDFSGFDSWVWADGSTAASLLLNPPLVSQIQVLAQKGFCSVLDSFTLNAGNCSPTRVFAPNVFSPNDDGENDVWEIFFQPGVSPLECQVFDRWGNLCYASGLDETPRWAGSFNGKPAQSGVYVWQFRLRNALGIEEIFWGDLLVLP